jgi:chromosome segregation protein
MRGGEMDDVIFNGTADRPARNLAEVSLLLDNADRSAPAAYNEGNEVEVIRRIERSIGSRYVINGRDVRLRDVQLLFADATSGANSTAIVGQGQVGTIINSKPQQRRGLLEEAAGIKGLHSRRHEAELRLKAAETNLGRVDDVMKTLEAQLAALKKQARQASRYRNISGHIRAAEAMLFHLRWLQAAAALSNAEAKLTEAEAEVASRTSEATRAATAQAEAAARLPALRETEAAAGAALNRLAVERGRLEEDENRVRAETERLTERLSQIESDFAREEAMLAEARETLARLGEEAARIEHQRLGEGEAMAAAAQRVQAQSAAVDAAEATMRTLTQAAATSEAERNALEQQMQEAETRLARLLTRLAETTFEIEQINAAERPTVPEENLAALRDAVTQAQAAAAQAEAAREQAVAAEFAARDAKAAADESLARVTAEHDALAGLLAINEDDLWPPLIDAVSVETGFEAALGAALGDDLNFAADTGAPVHWRQFPPFPDAPALPHGATALAAVVKAPPVLERRLSQVGLVESAADGARLAGALRQGQRLVDRDGNLWRWDGFTAAGTMAATAAQRLGQRRRLKQLKISAAETASAAVAQSESWQAAKALSEQALARASEAREGLRQEEAALAAAREAEAAAVRRNAELTARLATLRDMLGQLSADHRETEAQFTTARESAASLLTRQHFEDLLAAARGDLEGLRRTLGQYGAEQSEIVHLAKARADRLQALRAEQESWSGREAAGIRQIDALKQRRFRVKDELQAIATLPQEIARQHGEILSRIEHAEVARRDAADALAVAERELAECDRLARTAQEAQAAARETRVRIEAAVEQAIQYLKDIALQIRERLECEPQDALARADHGEGEPLPDMAAIEARLDRIRRERDNMGPVNLRADIEAEEIDQKMTALGTERDDLVQAIAKLRQGIASLNREGRERMLASFEQVNKHFQELFTTLFGGGRAHLAFVDSEDPLEAGLEIMASPPGKKLQSMSLLSGGEQALTAICLLFAVFLTNPAPICVLDEVDAPLDEANVGRFCDLIERLVGMTSTRFLIITHSSLTMSRMDRLFGVTMAERGVSQLVSVDLARAERLREAG